ncbi:diphthamide biosynthesis protein 3-like [Loxodonta africana]|nr:DPH3 homolog [Loxodonta africana]
MAVFHDEVEIEDFQYDDSDSYFYPRPCGDNFCITKEDLENGEDVATCPSCSLIIKVIYDKDQFMCGGTVPAPSTNKELNAEECLRNPNLEQLGTSEVGKIKCKVTILFAGDNSFVACCAISLWVLSLDSHIHLPLKKLATT